MNPKPGQYVKILFNVGGTIEGKVMSWTDDKSCIEQGRDVTVIQKTKDSVLLVKIVSTDSPSLNTETVEYKLIKGKFDHLAGLPRKTPEIWKQIGDLKKELNELEREDIATKIRSHTAIGVGMQINSNPKIPNGKYAIPNISAQYNSEQCSTEEGTGKGIQKNNRVPNMFQNQNKDQ